jgi:DASH complex subunit ASK1
MLFIQVLNGQVKFWTSFYEQAAQVRIPTYDDFSLQEQQSRSEEHAQPTDDRSIASSESSFMPGQGAVSSTPATSSRHHTLNTNESFASQNSDDPSWTASIESPLVRLDRQIKSLDQDDDASLFEEEPTMQQARVDKGKSKEQPGPLLRDVLRPKHHAAADETVSSIFPTPRQTSHVSPLKLRHKPKTPIASSSIHDSPQTSPQRQRYERTRKSPASHRKKLLPAVTPTKEFNDSFDDSFDLMGGMSPPVTMQFARAPRSSVGLGLLPKLGKTPKGEAADRIRKDLLGYIDSHGKSGGSSVAWGGYDTGRDNEGVESSMSTVPTPPSLSRYTRHAYPYGMDSESVEMESSLESMMRRVGLNVPGSATSSAVGSASRSVSASITGLNSAALAPPPHPDPELKTPDQQRFDDTFPQENQDPLIDAAVPNEDSDSDSDSFVEEAHNMAHPSAAFLMASQRQQDADDSFGSSNRSSDSLDDVDAGQGGMVHPFAGMNSSEGDAFDDDSFDNDQYQGQEHPEEETVFGVPPAQRQAAALPAGRGRGGQQLKLLGEDLLQDTIGIGSAMALAGRVEESPTPYPGPRG